jgi:protein-tyrosine phosphatase
MKTVLWIEEAQPSRLAIVLRPRGGDGLKADLEIASDQGIQVLVSLLTPADSEELGLNDEGRIARRLGMRFVSYPIPDRCTPSDLRSFRTLVADLRDQVRAGHSVGAHCRGCIGRATVLIASVMIALGWDATAALRLIERARGFTVPDTPEQLEWILNFHLDE